MPCTALSILFADKLCAIDNRSRPVEHFGQMIKEAFFRHFLGQRDITNHYGCLGRLCRKELRMIFVAQPVAQRVPIVVFGSIGILRQETLAENQNRIRGFTHDRIQRHWTLGICFFLHNTITFVHNAVSGRFTISSRLSFIFKNRPVTFIHVKAGITHGKYESVFFFQSPGHELPLGVHFSHTAGHHAHDNASCQSSYRQQHRCHHHHKANRELLFHNNSTFHLGSMRCIQDTLRQIRIIFHFVLCTILIHSIVNLRTNLVVIHKHPPFPANCAVWYAHASIALIRLIH